jgi:membrane associated rhomboid family serine protease
MAPPQQSMTMALPKPGRALWAVLVAMAALGILAAFFLTWVPGGEALFRSLDLQLGRAFTQPWRLLTSGLLTEPNHWSHLLFSLVGLYFLGAPLEKRWGAWRFARFLAIAVVLGNLTTLAMDKIVPPGAGARFHPAEVFGPSAAIAAIAVAWSREYAQSTVNLFFFLPMRARLFFWITIGFCVLDLIYPEPIPEGIFAPFGGVLAGLLFSGTPSLARRAWLQLRLAVLRRKTSSLRVDDVLSPTPKRRPRPGAPPLRVVSGGLEEVLKKRTPPKDKRYLN